MVIWGCFMVSEYLENYKKEIKKCINDLIKIMESTKKGEENV